MKLEKSIVIEMLFILAVAALLGLVVNFINPKGITIAFTKPPTVYASDSLFVSKSFGNPNLGDSLSSQPNLVKLKEPVIISTQQVHFLIQRDQAVLIDARTEQEFTTGRICSS